MSIRKKAHSYEHNQLGVTFFESGALDLAIEQFRLATKRAPWVASYWLNLGVALLDNGSLDEALLVLQQVIALKPNNQSAYYHLAQLYKKLGNDEAVRSAYQKTIELGPRTHLGDRAREYLEGWRPRIINASQ
jgi:Flp pilus assembly protein TadD